MYKQSREKPGITPNGARLRVAGSKTGTLPARGPAQVFAVQTSTVSWPANSWDSPEFTAKLLKLAPIGTTPVLQRHPSPPDSLTATT